MIHIVRHLFKSVHHGIRHSARAAKHAARATPLVWTQAGVMHKHTSSFWSKIGRWGFKFPRS